MYKYTVQDAVKRDSNLGAIIAIKFVQISLPDLH